MWELESRLCTQAKPKLLNEVRLININGKRVIRTKSYGVNIIKAIILGLYKHHAWCLSFSENLIVWKLASKHRCYWNLKTFDRKNIRPVNPFFDYFTMHFQQKRMQSFGVERNWRQTVNGERKGHTSEESRSRLFKDKP